MSHNLRRFQELFPAEDVKILRPPVQRHINHDMYAERPRPVKLDRMRELLGDEYFDAPAKPEPVHKPKGTYMIGDVAKMLGRKAGTLRMWTDRGYIPEANHWSAGSDKARKRLYTHQQAMGLLSICSDLGMIENKRTAITSVFIERVRQLWDECD